MQDYIFIRTTRVYERIDLSDIIYVQAMKNYCKLYLTGRSVLTITPLNNIETVLPPDRFYRIHRSHIISLDKLMAFDKKFVWMPDCKLPIGETYQNVLDHLVVYKPERKSAVSAEMEK